MFRSNKPSTEGSNVTPPTPPSSAPPAVETKEPPPPVAPPPAQQATPPPAAPPAPSQENALKEIEMIAQNISNGSLNGYVGPGSHMTGETEFKAMLRIDGHFTGRISSSDGTLIISSGGQVDADIKVAVAKIYGAVNGDVVATEQVELGRNAKLIGNIQTPKVKMEEGAVFQGNCKMSGLEKAKK